MATVDYTQIGVSRMDRVARHQSAGADHRRHRPAGLHAERGGQRQLAASRPALRRGLRHRVVGPLDATAAMTTSLNLRRTRFTADAFYTLGFSKSHDDHENGGFSSAYYVDVNNLENEYSWSNIDQRHQFTANGVFFLPMGMQVARRCASTGTAIQPAYRSRLQPGRHRQRSADAGRRVVRRNEDFRKQGFSDVSLRVQKNFTLRQREGLVDHRRVLQHLQRREHGDQPDHLRATISSCRRQRFVRTGAYDANGRVPSSATRCGRRRSRRSWDCDSSS